VEGILLQGAWDSPALAVEGRCEAVNQGIVQMDFCAIVVGLTLDQMADDLILGQHLDRLDMSQKKSPGSASEGENIVQDSWAELIDHRVVVALEPSPVALEESPFSLL